MEFRDDAHTLRPARGVKVETAKLIDLVLVMLGEPIIGARERVFLFEFHIGRRERKRNKSLRNFGGARRSRVFQHRRTPQGKRFIARNRFHGSILNWY